MNQNSKTKPDFFKDPVNPTQDEISKWAYGNYFAPTEDFVLFVVDNPEFTYKLALDPSCLNRNFFLRSLYVWVGGIAKNGFKNRESVENLLGLASKSDNPKIVTFVNRCKRLLDGSDVYDYSKWGIWGSYSKEL